MKLGVIVGRFQIPYLHVGHKALINYSNDNNDKTLIVVGVSPEKFTRRDPLPFIIRKKIISNTFNSSKIIIKGLLDKPHSDEEWSKSLDRKIKLFGATDVTMYGGRDSFIKYYTTKTYKTIDNIEFGLNISATKIRKSIELEYNESFIKGMLYIIENGR